MRQILGCDIADSGDRNVIAKLIIDGETHIWGIYKEFRCNNIQMGGNIISVLKSDKEIEACGLDKIGIGAGAWRIVEQWWNEEDDKVSQDKRTEKEKLPEIVGIAIGAPAVDSENFANLKSEVWWNMRLLLEKGKGIIKGNDMLKQELAAPRWERDPAGRIKIEPKAKTKKRLGRSPDLAEAISLAEITARKGSSIPRIRILSISENE